MVNCGSIKGASFLPPKSRFTDTVFPCVWLPFFCCILVLRIEPRAFAAPPALLLFFILTEGITKSVKLPKLGSNLWYSCLGLPECWGAGEHSVPDYPVKCRVPHQSGAAVSLVSPSHRLHFCACSSGSCVAPLTNLSSASVFARAAKEVTVHTRPHWGGFDL